MNEMDNMLKEKLVNIGKQLDVSDTSRRQKAEQLLREEGVRPDQAIRALKQEVDLIHSKINVLNDRKAFLEQQGGAVTPSVAIRKFKEVFPSIWGAVAQRIYKNVDNYGDYRMAYLEWAWAYVLAEMRTSNDEINTYPHQMVLDVFSLHKDHGFPFFFVNEGICDAAWQSDLKFKVDWKTIRLPFEAFTFILPKSFQRIANWEGITVYRHVKDGDVHFTLFLLGNGGIGTEITADYPFDPDADAKGTDALRLVFNTIYAMSSRPEYVEGGKRAGTHKETRSEIWTPNIIGRKYAVKSRSGEGTSPSGSVRLHWRRGHFRQQAHGAGRLQHRVIWIEPMMIGGKA